MRSWRVKMVKLYIKDNTTGNIHEYGTNVHDSLVLMEDGSLHYENLQNSCGTMFPEDGYSFCLKDGGDPRNEDYDGYIDIAGEFYNDKKLLKQHRRLEKKLIKLCKKKKTKGGGENDG